MLARSWTHTVKFVNCFCKRIWGTIGFLLLLGIIWPSAPAFSQAGSAISTATTSGYLKSNQSKVFYHDGKWWAIAFNYSDSRWYIWRYSGGTWSKAAPLNKSTTLKYDAVVNSAAGKLYVMGSHASYSEFWRFTYSSGTATWTKDIGFNVNPSFTNNDAVNPVSLVQAKNGDLWIFRVASNKLEAKRSTDGGVTWPAVITVKTGLTTAAGTTDAVAFTTGGNNYIGVAYGEADGIGSKYGFLIHRAGDPDATWTDESGSLTFFGSERANNKISAAIDKTNNVYLFTQNANVSGSYPNNTLYKRSSSGTWSKFVVNNNASGLNWKTPALAADTSNNALYVMGVNSSTQSAEYKACRFGAEASLSSAVTTVVLSSSGAAFYDLSLPAQFVSTTSGLMVCGDNFSAGDIWYNQFALGPISGGQTSVAINSVNVSPNEANAAGNYSISLTLDAQGALAAGTDTITVQFPDNTSVPSSIAANQITVNGTAVPPGGMASNSSSHELMIETPIDLANGANVTLVFKAGANILNPSKAGNYSLQAWTSMQTKPATSPIYAINAATTKVSAATVTPNPGTPNTAAAYAIAFNLGGHGRLVPGNSTITATFNNSTTVTSGSLSGVQVNGVRATGSGNSSNKTVIITVPASLSLGNNAAVTINLPVAAITNPAVEGSYTLSVATSVETSPRTSNAFFIGSAPPLPPTGVDNPIFGTIGGYDKPHQNRPFFHAGFWWTAAKKSSDSKWYLWKLNGGAWSPVLAIDERKSTRPDCYVDSPANKLYILLASSSSTGTKILRLSYAGGAWSIDAGFPVVLSSFVFSDESGNVFVKAKNGELWVFRFKSSEVDGKRSSDGGLTWSSIFTVKSGLVSSGLADAVAFTSDGQNYVGVGYAENTASSGKFGFLRHKDGDPDGSWTDETSVMPQFNNAQSDDHMSLAVSQNNEIFFVCKTHPNSSSVAGIGLLKRSPSGVWQNFTVQAGGGWTRPAVVVDETNNALYVFGTQESGAEHGQYKKCAIGNESALKDAAAVEIFDAAGFNNFSVPQHRVTGTTDLLVCVERISGSSEIWYNLLPIAGAGGSPTPNPAAATALAMKLTDKNDLSQVVAYPNPFNPSTTIRFTLNTQAPVLLQIYNIRGELVKTLIDHALDAGAHEQLWNGRDNFGRPVASGIYFYRLRLGVEFWHGRLEMVK